MESQYLGHIFTSVEKCKERQLWIVAFSAGLNSFLVTNKEKFGTYSAWVLMAALTGIWVYSVVAILNNGIAHVKYASVLRDLAETTGLAPRLKEQYMFKEHRLLNISGSLGLAAIVSLLSLMTILAIS